MSSVEIFAVVFFGVMGYLVVDHWLKRGEPKAAPGEERTAHDAAAGEARSHTPGEPQTSEESRPRS